MSSSVSSGATSASHASSFKDYEKKTFDVWDIDDDLIEYNQLVDPHLISIEDSEEMAKKVIKNHQEKQQLRETPTKSQASNLSKLFI